MMRYRNWIGATIAVAIFGSALIFNACGTNTDASSDAAPSESATMGTAGSADRSPDAMPDFELVDLDGKTIHLSDYAGKAVFVNFWATWCPPCRAELPDLVAIQNAYGGEQFTIIGISLDQTGSAGVKNFAQNNRLNYPIVMGNMDVVADYGNFRGIPSSFLLDRRHEKVKSYTGPVTREQLARDIKELVGDSA